MTITASTTCNTITMVHTTPPPVITSEALNDPVWYNPGVLYTTYLGDNWAAVLNVIQGVNDRARWYTLGCDKTGVIQRWFQQSFAAATRQGGGACKNWTRSKCRTGVQKLSADRRFTSPRLAFRPPGFLVGKTPPRHAKELRDYPCRPRLPTGWE